MATLRELSSWIENTLGGDAPRVNSLVKLVRGDGLFSSDGPGRKASMLPSDFATAIACSLTTAAPTKAAEDVQAILDLKTFTVSVDPCDGGGFRDFTVWDDRYELAEADAYGNRMLPPELSACPRNVGEALAMWAEHFMENPSDGVMDFDELVLRVTAEARIEVCIFNPSWSLSSWGNEDGDYQAYAWKLRFEAEGLNYDPMRREVQTKLGAHALRALADLAKGVA